MNIDLRRFLTALALPLVLLLPALLLQQTFTQPPSGLRVIWPYLPYFLLAAGLLLSVIFNHSREFNILLLLLITYWTFNNLFWPQAPEIRKLDKLLIFDLISILLPINFILFDLLKERGILNRHGLKRLSLILFQVALVTALFYYPVKGLQSLLHTPLFFAGLPFTSPLGQLALFISLLCIITQFVYVLTHPTSLQGALLGTLLCSLLAIHYSSQPEITRLFFAVAGLTVIAAIILNSHFLAYRDELTQLPSRRALKQQLMALGSQYSIAMVDVDHFKKLNDNHGHDVGDQVLRMLAGHLRRVKGGGRAYRYGGEEFTVVFAGKSRDQATPFLEQLREQVATTPFIVRQKPRPRTKPDQPRPKANSKSLKVTVSIGVADSSQAQNQQTVMKVADQALYKAKEKGRNRVIS